MRHCGGDGGVWRADWADRMMGLSCGGDDGRQEESHTRDLFRLRRYYRGGRTRCGGGNGNEMEGESKGRWH